tara:strand:+ start:8362 stop:10086 length:1725 start_codon:yes stop_codon:yes gene_type:complete
MLKNKKSKIFTVVLVVGFIMAATLLLFVINNKSLKSKDFILGSKQGQILKTYQISQKTLFYIDQSAKYSAHQTIYDLAQNGGCNNDDKYLGYNIWRFDEKAQCVPDTAPAKNNFLKIFSVNLDKFLSKYPSIKIPLKNYNLDFKDNNLLGIAINPLKILIGKKGDKAIQIGNYSIKPSFKVDLQDYDFSDYDKLRKKAEELVRICEDENQLEKCVNEKKSIFNDKELGFELDDKCETEEKEKFYKFVEYFNSCINSKNNNCACTENHIYDEDQEKNYNFELKQEGNDVIITAENNKDYTKKITNVDLADDNIIFKEDANCLHKGANPEDENTQFLVSGCWPINPCSIQPKTKFRFCVKSNKKVPTYDENNKKIKLRNVTYKFALQFKEQKQAKELNELLKDEATLQALKDEVVVLDASCKDSKEKTYQIMENIQNIKGNPVPLRFDKTKCITNTEKKTIINGALKATDKPILLIISSGPYSYISYFNDDSISLTQSMADEVNKVGEFSNKPTYEFEPIYNNYGFNNQLLAVKINLLNSDIETESRMNEYSDAITSGLIKYIINIKNKDNEQSSS